MFKHMHSYKIESMAIDKHCHILMGYTESTVGTDRFHFHFYSGVSTYTDHTHYFSGITGLPIKTENGHIHKIEGLLKSNKLHEHKYIGNTHEEISYSYKKKAGESLI